MLKPPKPVIRLILYLTPVLWLGISVNYAHGQCSITSLDAQYCDNDGPVVITGDNPFFNFYRSKVAGSVALYDPSLFGVGIDTVVATTGVASSYTISTAGTFNPIIRSGTVVNPGDDGETAPVTIPFTFNFFGTDYTQLRIGRNAVIGFGTTPPVNTTDNTAIPEATDPDNIIAAAWDDLDLGGVIQYFTVGVAPFRRFIIDYNSVPREVGLYPITTQIQLHETTNIIEIHTTTALFGTNANLATQGIENADGSVGYTVTGRNDAGWDASNDYVAFIPDCIDIHVISVTTVNKTLPVVLSENSICSGETTTVSIGGSEAGVNYQVFDQSDNAVSGVMAGGGNIGIVTAALTPTVTALKVRATHTTTGCSDYLVSVNAITVSSAPTAASAGSDINLCNNTTFFTLNANTPATGIGQWSVVNGTATIDTPGSPNSQVTGIAVGSNATLRWTISNGACTPSTDDVILTNYALPSAATAGSDIDQCNDGTFIIAANTPATGTGMWSIVSGSGAITNSSSATTLINGVNAGSASTLRWTISNGTCPPQSDDIILTNLAPPPAADAGFDQEQCNDGDFVLAANTASPGGGMWTILGASNGASLTSPASENSQVTGLVIGNSVLLRWTITHGACGSTYDDVLLTNSVAPVSADAGMAQIEQCDDGIFLMNATNPIVGSGFWGIVSGTANITDPASPTTTVTGVPTGTSTVLRWMVSNGSCPTQSDDITLINYAQPPVAAAGPDQEQCNNGTFMLAGNAAAPGSGLWTIVGAANGASITSPTSATSQVTGLTAGSSVTLRWTITNGTCTATQDEVVLTNYALPSVADAGVLQIEQCNSSTFTMNAAVPVVGNGEWSVVSGTASITNQNSATTTITGVPAGTSTVLRWTVRNGNCAVQTDDITLINYAQPPIATAGADQEQCNSGTFTLAGNAATPGSGLWTIIGSANGASITSPTSAASQVTGLTAGSSVTLRWTITNGTCAITADDVVLTNSAPPSVADAGTTQIEQCNTSTFTMNATIPATGTGEWSILTGTGTITNQNLATTTITGVPAGTNAVFRWTVSNGSCTAQIDNITLINYAQPPVAAAGPDQEQCNSGTFTLAGNPATPGSGLWTIVGSANGASITSPTSATSQVTGLTAGSSVTLRWTITNGTCAITADDVVLTNSAPPSVADAGATQIEQCTTSTFTMNATVPATGTGQWSILTGTGTITNQNLATTTITGVPAGTNAVFRWTVSNGSCTAQTDNITLINYAQPPLATAGADQEQCNSGTFTLAGNAAAPGSGLWTIVGAANGATITSPTSATSQVTGLTAGSSVTLRWTITNGTCTTTQDEVVLTNYALPSVADAGVLQIEQCNSSTFIMNAAVPAVGSGEWSVVSGTASITNQNSATTTITGVPAGTSAVLRWTVQNGNCATQTDDITLINYQSPTSADAGIDQSVCTTSVNLNANTPITGTGAWNIISGAGGNVVSPGSATSVFNGVAGSTYVLRWTITNGTCSNTDDVQITFKQVPDALASDQQICSNTSTSISITNPNLVPSTQFDWVVRFSNNVNGASAGSGTVISQLLTSADGTSDGTVTYRITPSANGCSGAFHDVSVTVKAVPQITNPAVSLSQQICSEQTLNFTPTTSISGTTLAWNSIVSDPIISAASVSASGSGSINDTPINTGDFSATVTYEITPSKNSCTGERANLVVTVKPLPSATVSNGIICSGETATINISSAPQNIAGTTFSWIANPTANVIGYLNGDGSVISHTLQTTDSNVGSVMYGITPSANGCNGPVTNATITVNPKATVSAGSDFKVCEPISIPLSGIIGGSAVSGVWEKVAGNGILSVSSTSWPTVTATYIVDPSDIGNVVVLRLKAYDPDGAGPCSEVNDEVAITINKKPEVSVPANYTVCETNRISLSGTVMESATSGSWSAVTAGGTLSVSSTTPLSLTSSEVSATYDMHSADVGTTMIFRLTTNDPDGVGGPCAAESATVAIHVNPSAKVDALENLANTMEVCEDEPVFLDGVFSAPTTMVTWSGPGSSSQFSSNTDPDATYTLSPADISAGTIVLTLTTNDPDGGGPCGPESSNVSVIIHKKPSVVIGGLDPSYAENDPAEEMVGGPLGGLFTGPGVVAGTNLFDPANANIGFNTIIYTYTSDKGCTNADSLVVVVNELTEIDFGICHGKCSDQIIPDYSPVPEICANIGKAYLEGAPDVPQGQNPTYFEAADPAYAGIIGFDADGYYINTDGILSGNYYIKYVYTNSNFAQSELIKQIIIYAAPIAGIGASNSCVEDAVLFTDNSAIPNNTLSGTITEWLWDFDDQGLFSANPNPTYKYDEPGVYNAKLTVTTDQGCKHSSVRQINIGPVPNVDFEWTKICSGERTEFVDLSTISGGFSSIEKYQWDFGDGTITQLDFAGTTIPSSLDNGKTTGTYQNPNHLFNTFSEYTVRLTVETDVGCVSYKDRRVYILDYPIPTPTMGYFEDFENGPGTWVKTALTGTSWAFGLPLGETINTAGSGSNAWWTGNNPNPTVDQSTYFNNETSEVIGPCLDLTLLKRPMVSLNYWSDAQKDFDGVVLQYSTDGGRTWETIGDNSGAGINWYNSSNLRGNPGGQDNFAWSNSSGGWRNARFNLDQIPESSLGQVVFRIAFGSNDDNPAERVLNGFAFDDVFIGDKQRNVLVEHFTNLSWEPSNHANEEIDNLALDQSDFFKIEYHVANPGLDSLNYYNPTAPAARGLFYGVAQPPTTIMDGILNEYYNTSFNGSVAKITREEIDRRSLEDPSFKIILDTLPSSADIVKARLTLQYIDSVQDLTRPVIVQVALVETDVQVEGSSLIFKNVVRKLLLDDTGLTIDMPWTYPLIKEIDVERVIDVPVRNMENLYLVAFVQDKVNKYILQSVVVKAPPKKGIKPVGLEDDLVISGIGEVDIYPLPASNILNLQMNNALARKYNWKVVDQRGITVLNGLLEGSLQEIDIKGLADGIYFVTITAGEKSLVHRKIAVINQN